ncbi:DUF3291 domain-containing protein [Pseudomonas sp. NPDC089547]|uniref:DUF3291 domain-containing protein n=1 Tax=Pseudomonas sp. NPDC089547 TaxID=3390652 RepID=UPI003CFDE26E
MKKILAQFDLVKAKYPRGDKRMSGFYDSVNCINSLAEGSPGFIWREIEEDLEGLGKLWGEDYLYTLSTWDDVGSLKDFIYHSTHLEIMKSGREWFHKLNHVRLVLWWVPNDHKPTLTEAHERLMYLHENGPSSFAFDFKSCDLPVVMY